MTKKLMGDDVAPLVRARAVVRCPWLGADTRSSLAFVCRGAREGTDATPPCAKWRVTSRCVERCDSGCRMRWSPDARFDRKKIAAQSAELTQLFYANISFYDRIPAHAHGANMNARPGRHDCMTHRSVGHANK